MLQAKLRQLERRVGKRRVFRWVKSLVRAIFLLGVGFVMLYPVLFMLSSAFKSVQDTLDPTVVWIPSSLQMYNFKMAFSLMNYGTALANTLRILLPSVALQVVSSLFIAYGFARFKFRGKNLLFGLLIFSIIVPTQSYMIPLYVHLQQMHLLNTVWQFYIQAAAGNRHPVRSVHLYPAAVFPQHAQGTGGGCLASTAAAR